MFKRVSKAQMEVKMLLTTSPLITEISTVVELVAHPVLRNAAATGTSELVSTAALVFCNLEMFNRFQLVDWQMLLFLIFKNVNYHSLAHRCHPHSHSSGHTQTVLGYKSRLHTQTGGVDSVQWLKKKM